MTYRVLLIGGGSGGHAYPLVAVAQSLGRQASEKNIQLELLMLGDGNIAARAAKEAGIPFKRVLAPKMRRYFSPWIFIDWLKIPIGAVQSLWHVFWFLPDAVFSKGGYDSVMPALAAKLFFIPLYIHESDSVPGRANRFLSRFARRIFISFHSAQQYFNLRKVFFTGNPVRPELFLRSKEDGLKAFNLSTDKKTVLVMGGSQGAKQINDVILAGLVEMVQDNLQIIHQCGDSQLAASLAYIDRIMKEGSGTYAQAVKNNYRPHSFLNFNQLADAYAACDIIVSRAGAGSLFEIAGAGKPAVIIPLAGSAGDHQLANAAEFAKYGAIIVEGANMTAGILIHEIKLLLDPNLYGISAQKIKDFAAPDAAYVIASTLLDTRHP